MNIYDIAKKAGVSSATVSRVINGSKAVSPKTTEKVRRIMEELEFVPNIFARSLQSNSIKVLGVLAIDISDIYFAMAIQSIERYAKDHNYDVQVSFVRNNIEDKRNTLKTLIEKRVDGIILVGSDFEEKKDNNHILEAAKSVPIVMLNGNVEGKGVYSVLCDDAYGIELAVEHLVDIGRKNIIYLYDNRNAAGKEKLKGYKRAMKRAGLEPKTLMASPGIEGGSLAISKYMAKNQNIDGIICSEDVLAVGVIKFLRKLNIKVPNEIAVIGYDNLIISKCSTPEITSVNGKVEMLSQTATKNLIDLVEGKDVSKKIVIMPDIEVRESTKLN